MSLDPQSRRLRSKQVGMLMQSYRRSYTPNKGSGRLSQEGLLRLMGQVDPRYFERYNHSTVARWESGATRPTRDRLEVFGKALQLTQAEIEGMIHLAGISEDESPAAPAEALPVQPAEETTSDIQVPEFAPTLVVAENQTYASRVVRYSLTRLALPGLVVAGSGYLLTSLGWNASWVMMLYINLAMGLILVQSFMNLRRTNELRELYFISVFFLLGREDIAGASLADGSVRVLCYRELWRNPGSIPAGAYRQSAARSCRRSAVRISVALAIRE